VIVVGIALVIAVIAVLNHFSRIGSELVEVTWPEEVPVALHRERAQDQHITHLVRLLAAEDPTEAHVIVTSILRGLELRPDPATESFLIDPPLHSAATYRRSLAATLSRIEES
jgi:Na+-transporting methylmalonyl-CoA/oxaloacetate decarboxylase gamma subunit